MNQGISAAELRDKLEDQASRKKDYKVPDRAMRLMIPNDSDTPKLDIQGLGDIPIRSLAHKQIRDKLSIPAKYYERLLGEAPDLLCTNVNHWLARSEKSRLVRTMDGEARAFLGDTYRPMDNLDFMAAIAKGLGGAGVESHIRSADVTEERVYIKVTTPTLESDILPPGYEGTRADLDATHEAAKEAGKLADDHGWLRDPEPIRGGAVFSNSEVGCGGLNVNGFVEVLKCTNAYVAKQPLFRKVHIGGQRHVDAGFAEFIRDETHALADRALWEEVADVVRGTFDTENFTRVIEMFTGARGRDSVARPDRVAAQVQEQFLLGEGERDDILDAFIRNGDLTQFGLAQAVTVTAGKLDDYRRATELETVGMQVIELPQHEWDRFDVAAGRQKVAA